MDKKRVFIILFSLILFVPFGLISDYDAWGEWDKEYYKNILGYIPKSIENAHTFSIIEDYGQGDIFTYYLSAIIGTTMLFFFFYLLSKINKNETN